jgi:hypothetical protein
MGSVWSPAKSKTQEQASGAHEHTSCANPIARLKLSDVASEDGDQYKREPNASNGDASSVEQPTTVYREA